jgi:hypothetical protein
VNNFVEKIIFKKRLISNLSHYTIGLIYSKRKGVFMKSEPSGSGILSILQFCLAVFLILSGLLYLVHYNGSGSQFERALGQLFGKNQNVWELITAIVQLAAGIVLMVGLFGFIPRKMMFMAALTILVLWGVQMVMVHLANDFLKPDWLTWLQSFSVDTIIFVGLWGCVSRYA